MRPEIVWYGPYDQRRESIEYRDVVIPITWPKLAVGLLDMWIKEGYSNPIFKGGETGSTDLTRDGFQASLTGDYHQFRLWTSNHLGNWNWDDELSEEHAKRYYTCPHWDHFDSNNKHMLFQITNNCIDKDASDYYYYPENNPIHPVTQQIAKDLFERCGIDCSFRIPDPREKYQGFGRARIFLSKKDPLAEELISKGLKIEGNELWYPFPKGIRHSNFGCGL